MSEDKAKLSVCSFSIAMALTWGIGVLFLGCIAWWFEWGVQAVAVIGSIYVGYAPSFLGVIKGTLWALFDGAVGGFLLSSIYNCCLCCKTCCPKICKGKGNKGCD